MISVTLYTREECHLCDEVKDQLLSLQREYPHELVEIDIDQDESLQRAFGDQVPVVEIGPYRKTAPFSKQELKITLSAAVDRERHLKTVDQDRFEQRKKRGRTVTKADRVSYWFSKYYMWVFNLVVFIYVGLPFLAPVMMRAGWTTPAMWIYRPYGFVCHQLAYRSWFLFGEQPAYPREAAGVETLVPFGEATGLSEGNQATDLYTARNFVGNDEVGYKVAFCERDVAIYAGILFFGLIYAFSRRRILAIPWYVWVIVGIGPIALDGFSQLLSQPPFSLWVYRESTPFLRTFTGGLFGFMTAWFGYPMVEETMRESRRLLSVKFARAARSE